MKNIHHAFLTRFNLPSAGVEGAIRSSDSWLHERVELFERYTIPSVKRQTVNGSTWIIYLDPESPPWLRHRMSDLETAGLALPMYRVPLSAAHIADDVRRVLDRQVDHVVTSNLDNDDGLANDFVERLLRAVPSPDRTAIYFEHGLIKRGQDLYLHTDRHNAFVAVAEPIEDMLTCWADWHNLLDRHMPVTVVTGEPAWLQVVHSRNVSNRVKGHLVSPITYQYMFGPLIADTGDPPTRRRIASRVIAHPSRMVRDNSRRLAVESLLMLGGKDAVDLWKSRLKRARV